MAETTILPPEDKPVSTDFAANLKRAKDNIELRAKYQEAKHRVSLMALETITKYPSYFDGITAILAAKINDMMTELRAKPDSIKKIPIKDVRDLAAAMESAQRGKYAAMRMEDVLGALSRQFENQGDGEGDTDKTAKMIQAPIPIIVKGSPEEIKARYDQKTD